jgi:hypothetical protein
MGRPPKLTPHQKREAIKRRDQGEESLADIGRSYSRPTNSREHRRLLVDLGEDAGLMSPVTVKVPWAPAPFACIRRSGLTSRSRRWPRRRREGAAYGWHHQVWAAAPAEGLL